LFLESNEETALICEDDVSAKPELPQVLDEVLSLKKHWDIVRMNCEYTTKYMPVYIPIKKLDHGYRLTVPTYYMPGAGAYLVNRRAAEKMIKFLLPMYLPWDHALYQNWRMGLTAMMVVPFPIELNEHKNQSAIAMTDHLAGGSRHDRLSFFRRYLFSPILPYRGYVTCQCWRKQLGTALWYRLFPPSAD
jgi:glycosyl transferase family 25